MTKQKLIPMQIQTQTNRPTVFTMLLCVCVSSVLLCLPMAGCASSGGGAGGTAAASRWQRLHDSGQYAEAMAEAESDARSSGGQRQAEAWYRGGVSALEARDYTSAERLLGQAARANRGDLSGRAWASLGLAYERQGKHRQAAEAFDRGADLLAGEDRSQSYLRAGRSWQAAGDADRARDRFRRAGNAATTPTTARVSADARMGAGYAVQVGAFRGMANAERAAGQVRDNARRMGLGDPTITRTGDSGATLWVVRVGRFATTADAAAAKAGLLGSEGIVVALP